jgi:tRNA dimethylallyltransferase
MAYEAVRELAPGAVRYPLTVIVGPTASGKTDLAQEIACAIGAEVLSADSMQVYRGMDIGTGKIDTTERKVRHHGLDLVDPGQPFSASLYQEYGRKVIADMDARGRRCVVCGGTGFYVRALIDGFEFPEGDQTDNPIRQRYRREIEISGAQAVWEQLAACDPESAALIPPNDSRKVVRAFEMLADGTSYSRQRASFQDIPQLYPACFIGLKVDPGVLAGRIGSRVDKMVSDGLVDEVEGLLGQGFRSALTAGQAIGYKEVVEMLEGGCTMDDAVARIKTATRRYAKRQRTWFRKDSRIQWLDADSSDTVRLTRESLALIARMEHEKMLLDGKEQ